MTPLDTNSTNTDDMSEFAYSWSPEEIFEGVLPEVIRFFQSNGHTQAVNLVSDRSVLRIKENGNTFCLLCVIYGNEEYYLYCPYRPKDDILQVDFDEINILEADFVFKLREKGILPF